MKWSSNIQLKFKMMPDAAREHIVQLICEGSEGMFLFARLVLENFYAQQNLEDVYKEMRPDVFPHGFDQAYARILDRIFKNSNLAQARIAWQLLGCITCVKCSLKCHEIQGAISIDVKQRLVNFKGRRLPSHIREICGSLVETLPGIRIQLAHKTARQYLISSKLIDEFREDLAVALLCLQYLTFKFFSESISRDAMQSYLLEAYYAFLDYAILHWDHRLETAIHFLKPDDLCHSADLGIAINEFLEKYDLGRIENTEARKDYV